MLFDRNAELILDFAFKSFTCVCVCMLVCLMRIAAQAKEENDSVWTCITFSAGKAPAPEGHVDLRHLESEIPGNFMLNSYRDQEGWLEGAGCPDVGWEADSWAVTALSAAEGDEAVHTHPSSPISESCDCLCEELSGQTLWIFCWGIRST